MDLFFELFQCGTSGLPSAEELSSSTSSSFIAFGGEAYTTRLDLKFPSKIYQERQDLRNNYLAFLLGAFVKAGLIEVLIEVLREDDESAQEGTQHTQQPLVIKAALLLGNLLNLANKLLPASTCAKLQVIIHSPLLKTNAQLIFRNIRPKQNKNINSYF